MDESEVRRRSEDAAAANGGSGPGGMSPARESLPADPARMTMATAVVIIALALAYIFATLRLPDAAVGNPAEPRVFPLLVGILTALLGLALLFQALRNRGRSASSGRLKPMGMPREVPKIAAIALMGVAYGWIFDRFGYVIATSLFLFTVLSLINGIDRWRMNLITSVSFSLFVYVLFSKVLGVHLPPVPGVLW